MRKRKKRPTCLLQMQARSARPLCSNSSFASSIMGLMQSFFPRILASSSSISHRSNAKSASLQTPSAVGGAIPPPASPGAGASALQNVGRAPKMHISVSASNPLGRNRARLISKRHCGKTHAHFISQSCCSIKTDICVLAHDYKRVKRPPS